MTDPSLPPELDPRGPRHVTPRRPRRPRWLRVLRLVASIVAVVVVMAAGGGYLLYRHYNGQITRVGIRFAEPPGGGSASGHAEPPAAADGSQNVLLMGSDSRDFAGGQAYNVAPGSAAYVTGQRSDVVMLLHVPAGHAKATVISFPRDSWVQIPAYTDAKGVTHRAVSAKLNAAFALGGAPLLVATIEELTGLHVDHFASVNFPGFQGMVDSLGGLDVCIGTSRHDKNSGDFLTAGEQHIDGTQALALVRDRESFPNQDLGRIKDQEYFLSVMLHKVLSTGTLTNPFKLNDFLDAATKSLTVDTGFSLGDMRSLASRFAHLGTADVSFATVPVANANYRVTSSVYGGQMQSAVELDAAGSAQFYASLSSPNPSQSTSQSTSSSTADVASSAAPASEIVVNVENATAIAGLARHVADQLAADGIHVLAVANAPSGTPPITAVVYPPSELLAARALQSRVSGAALEPGDASANALTLVVGDDYHGLTGTSSAAASPDTRVTTSASPISASDLRCAP